MQDLNVENMQRAKDLFEIDTSAFFLSLHFVPPPSFLSATISLDSPVTFLLPLPLPSCFPDLPPDANARAIPEDRIEGENDADVGCPLTRNRLRRHPLSPLKGRAQRRRRHVANRIAKDTCRDQRLGLQPATAARRTRLTRFVRSTSSPERTVNSPCTRVTQTLSRTREERRARACGSVGLDLPEACAVATFVRCALQLVLLLVS